MNGYLQTGIGIAVSVLLFWLSYRQTIGAKKERTKNANKSVHRALMRRMVLEDYSPKYKGVTRVLEGKAREFNTSINDMLSEEQILNNIYTEVFDSDLISPNQRIDIEKKLDELFNAIEEEPTKETISDYELFKEQNRKKRDYYAIMTVAVSMVGALTSLFYGYLKNPSEILNTNSKWLLSANSEWLLSGVGVFVASLMIVSMISIIKRAKEQPNNLSRRSALITRTEFELEVAKALDKFGMKYAVEPRIGKFRPDFLLKIDGQSIAVEAKSWEGAYPVNAIRNSLKQLEVLAEQEGVDKVLLVTKKPLPIKGINTDNSKLTIYSFNEFISVLKNEKAA